MRPASPWRVHPLRTHWFARLLSNSTTTNRPILTFSMVWHKTFDCLIIALYAPRICAGIFLGSDWKGDASLARHPSTS